MLFGLHRRGKPRFVIYLQYLIKSLIGLIIATQCNHRLAAFEYRLKQVRAVLRQSDQAIILLDPFLTLALAMQGESQLEQRIVGGWLLVIRG